MTQPAISGKKQKTRMVFPPFFAGIIGAFCLIFTFFITGVVWTPLVTYNRFLLMIQIPQMLLLGLFILLLTGAGAIKYGWREIPATRDAITGGIIAGVTMGIVAALLMIYSGIVPGNFSLPVIFRWFALMMAICASGAVAGAYLVFRSQAMTKGPAACSPGSKEIPFTLRILVFCIILTMVLPPALVFAGTRSGIIANDCSECRIHQEVVAQRLSNQSIQIAYTSKVPSIPWIGPYEHPIITINGKDVSNQFVIRRQGISCRIEPPEGLTYDKESSVVLSGGAVASDNSLLPHIVVVSFHGSPAGITIYENSL